MYIDPNTGGMLFQVLAASFAVFSGLALLLSGKIRAVIARARRSMRNTHTEEIENLTDTQAPSEDEN